MYSSERGTALPNANRIAALADLYQRAELNPPAFSEVIRHLHFSEKDARPYVTLLLRKKTLSKLGVDDLFLHHNHCGPTGFTRNVAFAAAALE